MTRDSGPPPFGKVVLTEHDPRWAERAAHEAARLAAAMGAALVRIEHVGSTSVMDLPAKPVVDLLPIVTSLEAVDAVRAAVEALGYGWHGELGIARRRFCTLVDASGARLVNVHAFAEGDPEIARHLAFRDYLRAHPEEARDYAEAKRRALAAEPDDVNAYNRAKEPWIKACELRALAWARR